MSLISSSYFTGQIAIPEKKFDLITSYITRYEDRIIYKMFGYTLGKLVIAYTESSPQRIKDIVEGKEYVIGDVTVKWDGLKNTQLISLIAYWVFYWYCRENETNITASGAIVPKIENAVNVGFGGKATFAWRGLLQLYGYSGQPKIIPSCFNFMQENIATYPEWIFESIGKPGEVNIFGL